MTAVFTRKDQHLFRAPAGQRAAARNPPDRCRPARSPRWGRSPPGLAKSTCGPSATRSARPPRTGAGLAKRRQLSHARRPAARGPRSSARPICAPCRTGSSGRSSRACRASPASTPSAAIVKQYQVQPDPAKLIALGLTFADVAKAIEANNVSRGARYHRAQRRRHRGARRRPDREPRRARAIAVITPAAACRSASGTSPRSRSAARPAPAAPAKTAARSWSAPP